MRTLILREPFIGGVAKNGILIGANLFSAFCWYKTGVDAFTWNPYASLAFGVLGFAVFGFTQGFASILNFIGYPLLGYFAIGIPLLNYSLGLVSFLAFFFTQFRPAVGFDEST